MRSTLLWVAMVATSAGVLVAWFESRLSASPSTTVSFSPVPTESETKPQHDKISAWTMAQVFVKRELKSPGTADFGSALREYQSPDERVEDLGAGKYLVAGWVDAQNGFGATMRNKFAVTVEYAGNGNWRAVEGPLLQEW